MILNVGVKNGFYIYFNYFNCFHIIRSDTRQINIIISLLSLLLLLLSIIDFELDTIKVVKTSWDVLLLPNEKIKNVDMIRFFFY